MDYYFITIFATVISGTLIFVIGQIILKFIIEPIHKQKEIIGGIADALIYYADVFSNPVFKDESKNSGIGKKREKGHEEFRKFASQIVSKMSLIPYYKALSILRVVIEKRKIIKARGNLIGLANGTHPRTNSDDIEHNDRKIKKLSKLLNLDVGEI